MLPDISIDDRIAQVASSGSFSLTVAPSYLSLSKTRLNYDNATTDLYKLIEEKQWENVIKHCEEHPEEAEVWIYRKEEDSTKLRWEILPIHAALIFHSDVTVIGALLNAYPDGAKMQDDQGMLPMHLAFRYNAGDDVVNTLIQVYPDAMQSGDKKKRIPIDLACNKDIAQTGLLSLSSKHSNLFRFYTASVIGNQRKHYTDLKHGLKSIEKERDEFKSKITVLENIVGKLTDTPKSRLMAEITVREESIQLLKTDARKMKKIDESRIKELENRVLALVTSTPNEIPGKQNVEVEFRALSPKGILLKKSEELNKENITLREKIQKLHESNSILIAETAARQKASDIPETEDAAELSNVQAERDTEKNDLQAKLEIANNLVSSLEAMIVVEKKKFRDHEEMDNDVILAMKNDLKGQLAQEEALRDELRTVYDKQKKDQEEIQFSTSKLNENMTQHNADRQALIKRFDLKEEQLQKIVDGANAQLQKAELVHNDTIRDLDMKLSTASNRKNTLENDLTSKSTQEETFKQSLNEALNALRKQEIHHFQSKEELQSVIEEQSRHNAALTDEITLMRNNEVSMRKDIEDTMRTVEEQLEEMKVAHKGAQEKLVTDYEAKINNHEEHLEDMNKLINTKDEKIAEITSTSSVLKQKLSKSETGCQSRIGTSNDDFIKLCEEKKTYLKSIDELANYTDRLVEKSITSKKEYDTLEASFNGYKKQMEEHDNAIVMKNDDLDKDRSKIKELVTLQASSNEEKEELIVANKKLVTEVAQMTLELKASLVMHEQPLNGRIAGIENEPENFEEEIQTLVSDLELTKAAHQLGLKNLVKEKEDLIRNHTAQLLASSSGYNTSLQNFAKEKDQLRKDHSSQLLSANEAHKTVLKELEDQKIGVDFVNVQLEDEIGMLRNKMKLLCGDLEASTADDENTLSRFEEETTQLKDEGESNGITPKEPNEVIEDMISEPLPLAGASDIIN